MVPSPSNSPSQSFDLVDKCECKYLPKRLFDSKYSVALFKDNLLKHYV